MLISSSVLNALSIEDVNTPDVFTSIGIKQQLKDELFGKPSKEDIVIIHCSYKSYHETYIRIWNSTVLIDRTSGHRSRLLQAINIPLAPVWMTIPKGTACFTLVFSALPANCECFDLYEDINASGRFEVRGIQRNNCDVYQVIID